MTVTTTQVTSLLENVLFESAATATANAATLTAIANLNSDTQTVTGLASYLSTQAEAGIAQQVVRYYEGALGRAPSGAEVAYYVGLVEQNLNPGASISQGVSAIQGSEWAQIAAYFTASPEFQADYGITSSGLTAGNEGLVINGLFNNILGRAATAADVTYFENAIASGTSISTLVQYFVTSQEYQNKVNAQITTNLANYGATVANLPAGGTAPANIGSISVAPTTTTTNLTTGIDNLSLSGNNNIVNGTANAATATFSVGDQIVGASGSTGNVLNLSDLTSANTWSPGSLAGVTISNIETVNLTSAEAVLLNTVTASAGFSGLTNLSVVSVSGVGAATNVDVITAGAGVAVKVNDTQNVATTAALTVTGGSSVSITENNFNAVSNGGTIVVHGGTGTTSVSVTQTEQSTAGADQAVTITDTNEAGGTKAGVITSVTLDGLDGTVGHVSNVGISDSALANLTVNDVAVAGSTVTITEGGYSAPATTLNLTLNNDASFTLTDAGGDYTTIAITAGAKSSAAIINDNAATTALTVGGGAGTVTLSGSSLGAVKTIAVGGAAGFTDTDYATGTTLTSVTDTSSGTVTFSLNDTVATFSGGTATGQEIVTITGDATKAITGGKATNNEIIFNAAAGTFTTANSGANITGFTVLGTGANSTGTFALNTAPFSSFKSIDVSASATVVFSGVAAGTAIAIDAGAVSITDTQLDSTGSGDTVALTLGTASAAGAATTTFIANDKAGAAVGTLTINSEGTSFNSITNLDTGASGGITQLTVTGNTGLQIGAWTDSASSVTITNNNTGVATSAIHLTDTSLTSLTYAGTNVPTVATVITLSDTGLVNGLTFNDTSAGAVTLTATLTELGSFTVNDSSAKGLLISDVTDNTLNSLTLNNTGAGTLTDGTANGVDGSSLSTVNFTGTGKEAAFLTNTYAGNLSLNDSDTAAVTLTLSDAASANLLVSDSGGAFTIATGATSSAVTINLTNTSTGTSALTVTSLTDNAATTVNLTGLVSVNLTDSGVANVKILGATDNANNTVVLNHDNATGSGNVGTDTVTLGNGNNSITINDSVNTANTIAVTVGSGANTIVFTDTVTHAASTVTFSAANGASATTFTSLQGGTTGDEVVFATNAINSVIYAEGGVATVTAGLTGAVGADGYSTFSVGGNTYVYENTGATATSELVELVGVVHVVGSATTAHIVLS